MIHCKSPINIIVLLSVIWLAISANTALADEGVYRQRADITVPNTGITMEQVENKFGHAQSTLPSIGNPPITRWQYNGFTVYFEHQRVIHSVITS